MATVEGLALYQYDACGYCARVRGTIARLGIEVEIRDTRLVADHARAVWEATGRGTVPLLRIEEASGEIRWIPESEEIIAYLEKRFG